MFRTWRFSWLGQDLVQFVYGHPELRIDAGGRHIQLLGDGLDVPTVKIVHHKRQPQIQRQPGHGGLQVIARSILHGRVVADPLDGTVRDILAAKEIDAQIPRDLDDPVAELIGLLELTDLLKSLDHGILRDILGVMHVSENTDTDQQNVLVVSPHQGGVRRPIPPANRHNQFTVATLVQKPLSSMPFHNTDKQQAPRLHKKTQTKRVQCKIAGEA
jgi:hypothetical protein